MATQFEIGDEVVALENYDGQNIKGKVGKVLDTLGDWVTVEFEENIGGHCGGSFPTSTVGKDGHCWNVPKKVIKHVEDAAQTYKTDQFCIGATVIVKDTYEPIKHSLVGKTGKVIHAFGGDYVAIEFDEYMGGHNSNGKGKSGHCWNIGKKFLEIFNPLKVGDRVFVKPDAKMIAHPGNVIGTVVGVLPNGSAIIEFDEKVPGGHHNGGLCKSGHGRALKSQLIQKTNYQGV